MQNPTNGARPAAGPLAGLKVVEFGHVIAGPMAGTLMADLGADVVHVEDPGRGDPARTMGPDKDGVFLWWKVSGRNKRSVTLNLREDRGQQIAHDLVRWSDVMITNMRVETLEKWQLDWAHVRHIRPRLVMLQVTGYGADSTLRNSPGFGKVGEARSGVVHVTGFADGPPVHTGFSHADTVTGLMGAFAVQAALYRRATDPNFQGEWIDLALFESLYRLIEWQVIVYDQLGTVPQRSGNQLAVAPAVVVNTYLSRDDDWITVTTGTPRSVQNVARLVGVPQSDVDSVPKQVQQRDRLDQALREWVGARATDDCLSEMEKLDVVASRIFSVEDILADATYREREDVISVDDAELGPVRMQAVVPKMHCNPGAVWRTGPQLGEDNDKVYGDYLGFSAADIAAMRDAQVI